MKRFNFSCELSEMSVKSNSVKYLSLQRAGKQVLNDRVSFQINLTSSSSTETDDLVDGHAWDLR